MNTSIRKHPIRAFLDGLYSGAGLLAALCLVAILGVIIAQMVMRWSGIAFPGGPQYAGYLMASATFLAFASALNAGAHIRVGLFLGMMGRYRFIGEGWGLLVGLAASSYLAWYAVKLVYWSHRLKDVSQGQDATPLWYVQMPMAAGAILLAIAFADNLVTFFRTGRHHIPADTTEQKFGE